MDRTAIEKIVELGAPNIIAENGYTYTDKALSVIKEPRVNTLKFHTLDGLVYTLLSEHRNFCGPLLVDVYDEETVEVYAAINCSDRQREIPYKVEAELVGIPFDRKLDYETMMITLKSKFEVVPKMSRIMRSQSKPLPCKQQFIVFPP